jgi:lipopolysaccharide/colanic/teichoic acid biosynthesis glycosyltransferase
MRPYRRPYRFRAGALTKLAAGAITDTNLLSEGRPVLSARGEESLRRETDLRVSTLIQNSDVRAALGARTRARGGEVVKRGFDATVAAVLLAVAVPLILVLAVAITVDSRGPAFFRCRRMGLGGREFDMLKFRKMHDGARGPALTATNDDRFTRMGRFLAQTKLDELPQLWNVLRGEMSLVGPRPEDPSFTRLRRQEFELILRVRPGITGLSQLAFARESEILDAEDRTGHYFRRILPEKLEIDRVYVERRSFLLDARILAWTAAAVFLRREVAVHRGTGRLSVRRRPSRQLHPLPLD